jgi:hypothetical protein
LVPKSTFRDWVLTPIGLIALWYGAQAVATAVPGTALLLGLIALLVLIVGVWLIFYVLRA